MHAAIAIIALVLVLPTTEFDVPHESRACRARGDFTTRLHRVWERLLS